jgi:hypothetical protein
MAGSAKRTRGLRELDRELHPHRADSGQPAPVRARARALQSDAAAGCIVMIDATDLAARCPLRQLTAVAAIGTVN